MNIQLFGKRLRIDLFEHDHKAPYLNRFVFFRLVWKPTRAWLALYRHDITRPDADEHLHNHPWEGLSLIARGGYWEQTKWGTVLHQKGDFNRIVRREYHRISAVRPGTRTYLLSWGKVQDWSYWVAERPVPASEYKQFLKTLDEQPGEIPGGGA